MYIYAMECNSIIKKNNKPKTRILPLEKQRANGGVMGGEMDKTDDWD